MITKFFKIGSMVFELEYPDVINPPENFLRFETNENAATPSYKYHIEPADSIDIPKETPIAEREDMKIYTTAGLERRLIAAKGHEGYYALYEEKAPIEALIHLNMSQKELFHLDTVFTSLFAFERRFLDRNGFILHCAYIRCHDEAILFSAASGVGKSTQASLWERYREAEVINGDRALLVYDGSRWIAHGWPVCGSSGICHGLSLPIRAIVMLSQAHENNLVRLCKMQAFSELYGQLTINSWDRTLTLRSMDLLELLADSLPVYHLGCTISEEAVNVLYDELYSKGGR